MKTLAEPMILQENSKTSKLLFSQFQLSLKKEGMKNELRKGCRDVTSEEDRYMLLVTNQTKVTEHVTSTYSSVRQDVPSEEGSSHL